MSSTPKTPINKKQASTTPIVSKTPVSRTDISANTQWNIGDRILCRYMNSEQQFYYEAKIIGIWNNGGSPHYLIHYQGWNSRYDEAVPHAEALRRFKRYTEEDAQKAKEELKKAKEDNNKRKTMATPEPVKPETPMSQAKRAKMQQDTPQQQKNSVGMIRDPKTMPQLPLPTALRQILCDDERLINKNMFLPKLPARVTVFQIIHDYEKNIDPNRSPHTSTDDILLHSTDHQLILSANELLDYFETTIESMLLYKFERPMFNELALKINNSTGSGGSIAKNNGGKIGDLNIRYAKQFGLPYLLRMFVRFPEMLSYGGYTDRGLQAIIRHAKDFLNFLSNNHQKYFDIGQDYIVATPDYHKHVCVSDNQR